jgi:hypothetical protein
LCNQRGQSGFFHEANDACRRAAELAPLWDRSVAGYVTSATEAGEDAAAVDRVLDRFEAVTPNRFTAESLRAGAAAARGNLLAAARHGSLALTLAPDDPWIQIFELALVARAAGDLEAVRRLTSGHAELKTRFAPVFDPDGAVARAQNAQTWWTSAFVEDEARHLLRAGRADLLLGLLEQQPLPLLELYRGRTWYGAPLGAQLVVALRGAGRDKEANSLTQAIRHDLDQMAARRYSHFNLDLANAIAFALDARGDDAVVSLERAVAKGWRGQTSDWAVDPADEPAFAGLRGRADFERVRARMAGEIDRVRVEIAEILAQTPIPKVKTIVADDS